ncbi:hypothetical protein NBRC116597_12760 [Phaeobacter sp. NW0010-22]
MHPTVRIFSFGIIAHSMACWLKQSVIKKDGQFVAALGSHFVSVVALGLGEASVTMFELEA